MIFRSVKAEKKRRSTIRPINEYPPVFVLFMRGCLHQLKDGRMLRRKGVSFIRRLVCLVLAGIGAASCSGDINVTTAPQVVAVSPQNGKTDVPPTVTITAYFSRVMDSTSITRRTFSLTPPVDGDIEYHGTSAQFIPLRDLAYYTTYTVTLTTGIRDKDGIPLESDFSWSFTTRPAPPTITRFAPDSGRVGTIVTINGTNFIPHPDLNIVKFNEATADITAATSTQIVARVPGDATTGPITVLTSGGSATSAKSFLVIEPGRLWETVTSVTSHSLADILWTDSQFVAVGAGGTVITSPDGLTWEIQNSGVSAYLNGIAESSSAFVVVGDGGTILVSTDGKAWERVYPDVTRPLFAVTWFANRFVAVGGDGVVLISYDGRTWEKGHSITSRWLYGLTSFGDRFIACGDAGTILTSRDGYTWHEKVSGVTVPLLDIAHDAGMAVAVGYDGEMSVSSDGLTWFAQSSPVTVPLGGICRSGKLFVAVGAEGTVLTSENGVTWVKRNTPTDKELHAVAWSGTRFIAVGEQGVVLTSY